ncbi:hypothetical protein DFS34DRAFT_361869 [Phlyctochytrium arcticum]|nr:hypothetical protein DFS34DRAFT_361869 [Phlyctochytrium arcticum]
MTLSNWELDGVDELINYLQDIASKVSDVNNVSKEDRKAIKRSIPPKVKNVQKLLRQLRKHLTAAQQLLSESKEKIVSNGSSDSKPVPSVTADPLPINTVESNPPTAPLPAATVQIPTLPPANQPGADAEDSDDWLSDLTEMEFLDSDVGSQRDDWTTDDSSDGSDDSEMDHTDMYLPNPKHAVKVKGKRRRHEKDKANGGVERVKRPRVKDDEDDDAPSSAALSRERTKSLSHERTKSLSHERTKSLSPNDQIPQIPRHTSLRPTLSLEPKLERPLVNPAPPKPVFKPSATIYQPYPPRVSASPGIVVPSASSTIVGPSASPTIVGPEAGTPMNPVFANPSAVPVPPKEKEKKPAVYSRLMKTMTKMSKRR